MPLLGAPWHVNAITEAMHALIPVNPYVLNFILLTYSIAMYPKIRVPYLDYMVQRPCTLNFVYPMFTMGIAPVYPKTRVPYLYYGFSCPCTLKFVYPIFTMHLAPVYPKIRVPYLYCLFSAHVP